MNPGEFSRRRFLIGSLSTLGGAWLAARWPMIAATQEHIHGAFESGQAPAFQFFSPEQAVEIEAMAAQIIPADDAPGAREARVIYSIDRALTTFEHDKQPLYRQGLTQLQGKTRGLFSGRDKFSELTSEQQVQLLTAIEKSEFFELVRLHTIVGFLSNPEYGGNHDRIGWKVIGFEDAGAYEPPFGYYDREINKDDGR